MEFRKNVSILGIMTGSVVAVVGSIIVGLVIGIFYGILLAVSGTQSSAMVDEIVYTNPYIVSITFLVMALFSILGGYITAYIAKHDELLNGALSGSFLLMLSAIFSMYSDDSMSAYSYSGFFALISILSLIATPLLSMFGGYLRLKQTSRKKLPSSGVNLEADFQPQELQPEQPAISAGTGTAVTPPPAPAKKSNRVVFVISGALLACSCLCIGVLCAGISGLAIGAGMAKVFTEWPKVESVIDEYMSAMADQDASKAYALYSARSKRNTSLADIEDLLEGNNYTLFEGYQSLAVTYLTLNSTFDSDPDLPQGEVAEVEGTISYTGGFTGNFTAVLEQEGDEWRLFEINVTAPPDKYAHNFFVFR